MPNKLTQEEFIERAKKVHGDKYLYDKTIYSGALKAVTISCPVHGDFQQRAATHLNGSGCMLCSQLHLKPNSVGGVCDIVNTNADEKKIYDLWYGMLQRCKRGGAYENCVVCEEWKLYSNFKKWFDENYIEGYAMDKDLFSNGKKIYSPETCCFIPASLNTMLAIAKKRENGRPTCVYSSDTKSERYRTHFTYKNKRVHVGSYNTKEEAFNSYADVKEALIKQEAEKLYSEGKITDRVYNRLLNLKIEELSV